LNERVIAYIDGFNLYFGLKTKGWKKFYWLDLALLAANLLKSGQQLSAVRYFTARISGPPDKQQRQNVFLEANEAMGKCRMYFGQYLDEPFQCRHCGATHLVHHEKMTDVNIAVHLFEDAFLDAFDTALLVSGDSDLVPPVAKVRVLFPRRRVVVAFPAGRFSKELAAAAHGYFTIGRRKYEKSLLPPEVTKSDGTVLRAPREWR
jgi:uncharacterized LabA/DUF88 family protein